MENRRQRLEFALSILPYNAKAVQLSFYQQQVEEIITRLRTDLSDFGENESVDDDVNRLHRRNEAADTFAEHTMRNIELSEITNPPTGKLSTLDTLTLAAEKLLKTQQMLNNIKSDDEELDDFENDEFIDGDTAFANMERNQLMENTIQNVNEARVKMLQRWERSKRTALDLLTVEIEKVQDMDQTDTNTQKSGHFQLFRDGTDEHNTSTPKTNEEENIEALIEDPDDEDYVPETESKSVGKRVRVAKPMTSTPKAKKMRPTFEFDHDQSSPMVVLGPNGTQVSRSCLNAINWDMTGPSITRKLLCEIFDRETLAHHTLSGKPSPAFRDCARPTKQQLDPRKVADLVYLMTNSMDMTPREVRTAITTKCADENKMLRSRLKRGPRKSN
ncbi:early boundary activity protein 1 [Drosophila willistoni]|uniref:early boundary activity protein 1 n=1 Tax=Drosophila willistoni TaxID=7260 RepID=UPI00017D716B|nr:early boundary activity protein 1 [Drosophila willistoni]